MGDAFPLQEWAPSWWLLRLAVPLKLLGSKTPLWTLGARVPLWLLGKRPTLWLLGFQTPLWLLVLGNRLCSGPRRFGWRLHGYVPGCFSAQG